jgi:hypothetical protein
VPPGIYEGSQYAPASAPAALLSHQYFPTIRTHVVERAEDEAEACEPERVKRLVLDVGVPGVDRASRVELAGCRRRDRRLGLRDVGLAEEELPVEIREIDRVEVDLEGGGGSGDGGRVRVSS